MAKRLPDGSIWLCEGWVVYAGLSRTCKKPKIEEVYVTEDPGAPSDDE